MSRVLHSDSVAPLTTDGRDIDATLAVLSGEAALQVARADGAAMQSTTDVWRQLPEPSPEAPTYYDRPVLKPPVWKVYYIATYYYLGGTAGASLALAAAAQLDGSEDLNHLIRRCHWIGIIGSTLGAGCLIADLGRPSRFLLMLRVFRPTSAMNMGAWVLAVAPAAAVTAGLFARSAFGVMRVTGEFAGYVSGLLGMILATYTGVLVAESAIPFWQHSRRVLPILFGASSAASAGSIFDLMFENPRACRVTRIFGIAGRVTELGATVALEREVTAALGVAAPIENGFTAALWRGAGALTAASLVALLLPKQTRKTRVVAGVLGSLGSLLMRYAVHECGVRSARDPRASFGPQRAGLDAPRQLLPESDTPRVGIDVESSFAHKPGECQA
jgi:formate-dependent nitrite reductase membrane component NrfD